MADIELSLNERKVLLALSNIMSAPPEEVLRAGGFSEIVEVMSAASWLKSKGLLEIQERIETTYLLDKEGIKYLNKGELPEITILRQLFKEKEIEGISNLEKIGEISLTSELINRLKSIGLNNEEIQIGLGWIKKNQWATISKRNQITSIILLDEGKKILASHQSIKELDILKTIANNDNGLSEVAAKKISPLALQRLITRKNIIKVKEKYVRTLSLTENGRELASSGIRVGEEITQLTPEILQSGRWKDAELRPYDVHTFAPATYGGKAHVLRESMARTRDIFLHMGFTEIRGDYVESCFWNMDVLFIPQDHPARDAQDTFYLRSPASLELPPELVEKVKKIHESGGDTGSEGWKYRWSEDEARRALLRTHTTVNTIRYLSEHPEPPVKVFSVGKVFRREATDPKHLAEFHQIEGIVMEEGANFRMLIGLIKEFYGRMGFPEVRFRPSYFPYTEPSLEVEVLFGDRWMELGGAGIFRPEVTAPFNIKHPVLAWGLGLERLVMKRYGISDMRQLYMGDLEWMRKTPIL